MQSERNIMDATGELHRSLTHVLEDMKKNGCFRQHLANVLGSDEAVTSFGLNSDALLVVHPNGYGYGPGVVPHGDFEGDKKASCR
jgi:hypothetical protein